MAKFLLQLASAYFRHITGCFYLHCAVINLTNANVNVLLTQFCKVFFAGKACPFIIRFDKYDHALTTST